MSAPIVPVALVTGAGSGIGRATALVLARSGVRLILVGRRAEPLEQTAALLPEGSEAETLSLDVADPSSAQEMVQAALDRFGRLDILVNNAGAAPLLDIDKTTPETIQQVYMTNAVGPACAIAAAWPVFKRQHAEKSIGPFGHVIVNVSTMGTADPFPGFFAYAASKAPCNVMARSCANEGRPLRIRAFSVAPGAVETPLLRSLFSTDMIPKDKAMPPERVAEEILACITGERDAQNGGTIYLKPD